MCTFKSQSGGRNLICKQQRNVESSSQVAYLKKYGRLLSLLTAVTLLASCQSTVSLPSVSPIAEPTPVSVTGFSYQSLVFAHNPEGVYQVAIIGLESREMRTLTSSPAPGDAEPDCSLTSQKIVFISGRNQGNDFEIFSMNLDGSDQQPVITTPTGQGIGNYAPQLSPDGAKLLFHTNRDGNMEVYVANADGSNLRNLTRHSGNDAAASWSPDGQQIVFASDREGTYDIYVMDADGSNVRPVYVNSETFDFRPRFSPDGTKILFGTQGRLGGDYHIAVVAADGSEFRQITQQPGYYTQAAWLDADTIVFSYMPYMGSNWQIATMKSDGSDFHLLAPQAGVDQRNPAPCR